MTKDFLLLTHDGRCAAKFENLIISVKGPEDIEWKLENSCRLTSSMTELLKIPDFEIVFKDSDKSIRRITGCFLTKGNIDFDNNNTYYNYLEGTATHIDGETKPENG